MSMAIARAKYTGDPGLFGDIFRGVTGAVGGLFTGGPLGALGGAVTGFRSGRQPPVPIAGPGGIGQFGIPGAAKGTLGGSYLGGAGPQRGGCLPPLERGPGGYCAMPAPGIIPAVQRFFPGGATGLLAPAAMNGKAMNGYHWNTSDYFLKSGQYVPAGSRMVKNRKRNPANARATSRAISRIGGAKTYAKTLARISIRKKC